MSIELDGRLLVAAIASLAGVVGIIYRQLIVSHGKELARLERQIKVYESRIASYDQRLNQIHEQLAEIYRRATVG